MIPLLDELNSPLVGYWHDFGHIQIKENLGFLNHEEWLRAIGPRTLGLSRAGLRLAGAGSSAAFCRRRRSGETGSASAAGLLICLGNEPAQNGGGNPPLRQRLENAFRRMKKILVALLQIAVTVAVLFWVFHDPQKRAQMAVALRTRRLPVDRRRDFRLFSGRIRGRGSLADPAQGAANSPQHSACLGTVPDRDVLQPVPARRHRRRYHEELPAAQGNAGQSDRRAPRRGLRPVGRAWSRSSPSPAHWSGCVIEWLTQLTETRHLVWILLAVLSSAILMLVTSFVISGFNLAHKLPQRFPGREKLIELSAAYHLYAHHWRATLAAFAASLVAHLATFTTFLCVPTLFGPRSR